MKSVKYVLRIILLLILPACIPLPLPTPTPTAAIQTGTATPIETPTSTPTATPIETSTSTPSTIPEDTETPTLPSTGTETGTPTSTVGITATPGPIDIPALEEWDAGNLAFSHGAEGEWDHILWGGFANSLIKKGDTYYLYYQGSSFYDEQCESVAHRAIGLATSTDGLNWVKSPNNPVITWSSQGSVEEGAVGSAAWLGEDGRFYVYYGANTGTGCNIRANLRLAVSEDGENFQDAGEVLSARDPNVWGFGDELHPVGAYAYAGQWYLYYIPNGVALARRLGLGIGNSSNSFPQSLGLNDSSVPAWGPVSVVLGEAGSVLVTNPEGVDGPLNFYRFDAGNPAVVELEDSYTLPNCRQASVVHERGTNHWVMLCRDETAENYFIRNAFTQ
jgi:hypothetical protein